ncbi:FKBP-type peptidyl-prolyl cis-trans isomerase FkpA precursor [hydrothermal vent metagenome]|uniref:peptidylprolyl isomerase n=1 Tax=hydrothermal vent metagenome TaxID=652676 RepID=A0A3B0SCC7_9ZZZZ
MRNFWIITAGAAALTLAGCGGSDESKAAEASEAAVQSAAEEGAPTSLRAAQISRAERKAELEKLAGERLVAAEKFLAENAKREGVAVTDSGLQYMVLEEGPEGGATPVSTDLVVVHYVGTLKDGVEFDSSRARGAASAFRLNAVIPGWTEGVQLMSEGDRYRFFVPPDLAYGKRGGGPGSPIGPNDALIFDMELIKVQNADTNLAAAKKFLDENAKEDGVKTTPSGLQYQVLAEGKNDGLSPKKTDTVRVHYRGTLLNGTEFDSSYASGKPIEFPLNRVIGGWTEGVQLMSEGDKFRFFIPPELAYGEAGTPGGPIGPNEALIFEVELIAVK